MGVTISLYNSVYVPREICNNLGVAVTGNYNTKGYQTSTIYRLFIVEILSQQPQVYNNYSILRSRYKTDGSVDFTIQFLHSTN
jgi:hypothetical protein